MTLYSCGNNANIEKYEIILNNADRVVIHHENKHDSTVYSRADSIQNIKELLKRNIKPKSHSEVNEEKIISLYAAENRTGFFTRSLSGNPFVSFYSDSLKLTFPMTYGIGMLLSEFSE